MNNLRTVVSNANKLMTQAREQADSSIAVAIKAEDKLQPIQDTSQKILALKQASDELNILTENLREQISSIKY